LICKKSKKINIEYKEGRIDIKTKTMYSLAAYEAINSLIFSDKGSIKKRVELYKFLHSEGSEEFDLSIKVNSRDYPANLKTITLDKGLFNNIFAKINYLEIMNSLNPARISPQLPSEAKNREPTKGVIEFNSENILRSQRDAIIGFANFLKKIASNKRLEIRPYKTYISGLAYSKRSTNKYLDFFPDANNPQSGDQHFILDGRINGFNLKEFNEGFKSLLGGLLVDHQTFVINEINDKGEIVGYLCAFNLLIGALGLDPNNKDVHLYIPRPTTTGYVSAPIIESFDVSLYNTENPNNVINVMKQFQNVLIGYQRVGASQSEERMSEITLWKQICNRLSYIFDAF
jgi:hypothetical protein